MAVGAPTQRLPGEPVHDRSRQRGGGALRVRLLGPFAIEDGATSVPRSEARVVALAALSGTPLTRARVATTLWPDLPEDRAAACLRAALSRLGRVLPHLLGGDSTSISLSNGVVVDAREIEDIALRVVDGDAYDGVSVHDLAAELLPGWEDDWVEVERERLRALCLQAIEVLADRFTSEGRYGRAVATVYEALRIDPLRESAARALLEIHLAQGNQVQAARYFLDFRARLRAELNIEPSDAMRALMSPLISGA
jgi:DNA-binding SARP family transcriptional activator